MRPTTPATRSCGDVLGLMFFLVGSAAVLVAVTGVDVLGREVQSEAYALSGASALCPANAD